MAQTTTSTRTNVSLVSTNARAQESAVRRVGGCQNFDTPVTLNEAVEAIGGNFEVRKDYLLRVPEDIALNILGGDGLSPEASKEILALSSDPHRIITSHRATVNCDNERTLGVVGSNYGILQNAKAFEFVDILTSGTLGGEQKPIIETAGVLGDGKRMYISARMPELLKVNGDDPQGITDYLLFTNSHDGTNSLQVFFTPIRVVCQNTLNAAMGQAKTKLSFKHTSRIGERLDLTKKDNMEMAMQVLKMHERFKEEFIAKLNHYAGITGVTENTINEFAVRSLVGSAAELTLAAKANFDINRVDEISTTTKNKINLLKNAITDGIGQDTNRGSFFWLYNGLTTYLQNAVAYKSEEVKMDSILDGTANKIAQRGVDALKILAA